ncbi:hypothetical protein [Pantoea ananatis]|nr:hypothetical protein [Pantoea ananatis]
MTTNSPNPVDGDVQAHQMPVMTDAERQKSIDAISTRMRSISEEGDENLQFEYDILRFALIALTTPPAQLLRPVELPDIRRFCSSHINCKRANELLSQALRQQGYEVKSNDNP